MKAIVISILILLCLSAKAQVNTIHMNSDEIIAIIEDEIEFAIKEIQKIELDFNDIYIESHNQGESIVLADKWFNKHHIDFLAEKEQVKIELLEVMENLEKNEEKFLEKYNEKIERWNETKFYEENSEIQPLK